ncbi:unnamed protein product, partial [Nesidiocoris tenuis]
MFHEFSRRKQRNLHSYEGKPGFYINVLETTLDASLYALSQASARLCIIPIHLCRVEWDRIRRTGVTQSFPASCLT